MKLFGFTRHPLTLPAFGMRSFDYLHPNEKTSKACVLSEELTWGDIPPINGSFVAQCGATNQFLYFTSFRGFTDYTLSLPQRRRCMKAVVLGNSTPRHVFFDIDAKPGVFDIEKVKTIEFKAMLIDTVLRCYRSAIHKLRHVHVPSVSSLLSDECWVFDASCSETGKISLHVHLLCQIIDSKTSFDCLMNCMDEIISSNQYPMFNILRDGILDTGVRSQLRMATNCKPCNPGELLRVLNVLHSPSGGGVKRDCVRTQMLASCLVHCPEYSNQLVGSRPLRLGLLGSSLPYALCLSDVADTCAKTQVSVMQTVATQFVSQPVIRVLDDMAQKVYRKLNVVGGIRSGGSTSMFEFSSSDKCGVDACMSMILRMVQVIMPLNDGMSFIKPKVSRVKLRNSDLFTGWFCTDWLCPTRPRDEKTGRPTRHTNDHTKFYIYRDSDRLRNAYARRVTRNSDAVSVRVNLYCHGSKCRKANGKPTMSFSMPCSKYVFSQAE